jgi:hypothetical protein
VPEFSVKFTGQYNTRIAKANALSAASGVVGVGVVGTAIVGAAAQASDKDERYVNCFLTKMGSEEYIIKRPGMAALNTPQAGSVGSAILVWSGQGSGAKVISAFGATNSSIYDGTTQLVTNAGVTTAITGKANGITETEVSGTATLTITSGDSTAWYYQDGGTVTKITDAQYPGNDSKTVVGKMEHMDGFACVLTLDGYLYVSDSNSVTSWTSTSRKQTNAYPDKGVGCVRYKTLIAAFGTQSVEFYQNAGLTPFPFQRVTPMTQKVGAISADAIGEIADTLFWVGATPQGGLSVFQFDGGISRISTPEQDFQLALAGPTNISVTTLRTYGRSFVLVKASSTTYVYVLEDKRWHEWASSAPVWYKCAGLSVGSQILTYSISNVSTSGKVYVVNPSSLMFTDDGTAFTFSAQSRADDNGTGKRKIFSELSVAADVEPTSSPLTVSYSDDDYGSWTVAGTIDLADQRKLTRLGATNPRYGNKRAWKFTHSENTAVRIRRAAGQVTVAQG